MIIGLGGGTVLYFKKLRWALIRVVNLIHLQGHSTSIASIPVWNYRIKIFAGASKRTPRIVHDLQSFNGQFTSVKHLHQVLCAEVSDGTSFFI